MVTSCTQLLVLLFTSTTVHVTGVTPTGKLAGALLVTEATPQLSVAASAGSTKVRLHTPRSALFVSALGQVNAGRIRSRTITVALQVATLPCTSVTVSVTPFDPTFAQVKLLGTTLRLAIPQLSVLPLSMSAPEIAAVPKAFRSTVMFLHNATGNCVSVTVTVKLQVLEPPKPSRTTHVTAFVPTGKVEPTGGTQVTLVTTQPSTTGTDHVTLLLLHWPKSALAAMSVGQGKFKHNVSTTT